MPLHTNISGQELAHVFEHWWNIMGFLKTAYTCKKLKAQGLGNVTGCVAYSKLMHGCQHVGLAFFANWQPPHVSL